mmetsp:Transcript_7452/g.23048  ORF Transcript_7452/g.23048 Transcript_7452/m.23048 type:complete len:270 (-) Transcript_7452:613-1422(-)|eukprot:scaffold70293_cov35-Tisochrysis_lutea.AAC.3
MRRGHLSCVPPSTKRHTEEDVECPICLDVYVMPIVLKSCGHAFCRLCIIRTTRCSASGHLCPICRHPILSLHRLSEQPADESLVASAAAVLSAADQRTGSDAHASRHAAREAAHLSEIQALRSSPPKSLPVFYMWPGTQPGARVALHLFETRYRVLMRRVWEGERLILYADSAPHPGGTAVVVRIDSVHFLPDGRANIVGHGVRSVRIREAWVEPATAGLYYAKIEEGPSHQSGRPNVWLDVRRVSSSFSQERAITSGAAGLASWCSIL